MSDFLNRLTRRIEARSSRRGFFTTMGKVVAGVAAAMVGGGIFSESNANAAPNSLLCCSGSECYNDQCSSSEYVGYTWCCRIYSDNPNYIPVQCVDCYSNKSRFYACTYAASGFGVC